MPRRRKTNETEEQSQLVANEQQSQDAALDDDYGADRGGVTNAGGFIGDIESRDRFVPATLPHDEAVDNEDYYANVELQTYQVQISDAPPDRFNYTYLVFYLLGIGSMTPWNFFVTAEDYWMYKFRNTTLNESIPLSEDLTPLQKSFTCDLTLTASISGTTFLILNAIYGHYVSLNIKMIGTLVVILALFGVTTAFVEINTDSWQEQFFIITLFTVVLQNICAATMSGGIFGIAGLFPSKYMTAVVSGQALGGIVSAIAFLIVLTLDSTPQMTALIYFSIGIVTIFGCVVCYVLMTQQSFFKYFLEGGDKYKIICETPTHSRTVDTGVSLEPILGEVMSKIYVHVVCVCLVYATSLSVYPAVTVLMQSEDYGSGGSWSDVYFLPVVNYLVFNCGDYLGRLFAGWLERPRSNRHLALMLTFLRIIFVPLLMCGNSTAHNFLPVLVHSDWAFILIISAFALSNGYLTNILLIMAPRAVKLHEREMASSIMVAALSCGLALGSLLSMVFVQLL